MMPWKDQLRLAWKVWKYGFWMGKPWPVWTNVVLYVCWATSSVGILALNSYWPFIASCAAMAAMAFIVNPKGKK